MKWTVGPDNSPTLILEREEPLLPAYGALWKRALSDALAAPASGWVSLALEIQDRQTEDDDPGTMSIVFFDGSNNRCRNIGPYSARGDAFDLLQGEREDNQTFNRREIRWFLEHYALMKQAAQTAEVQLLFRQIARIRPLPIVAATAHGWFDPKIGEPAFGPLPSEDQALLAGLDVGPINPLADLMAGVVEVEPLDHVRELKEALIEYTPPHFEIIDCEITLGTEQGRPALFYNIQCPQFPDEGTTVVNDRVHRAATRLVSMMTPAGGTFPGVAIRLELLPDGNWRSSLSSPRRAA
jgi:hypothetical protein